MMALLFAVLAVLAFRRVSTWADAAIARQAPAIHPPVVKFSGFAPCMADNARRRRQVSAALRRSADAVITQANAVDSGAPLQMSPVDLVSLEARR